MEHLTSCLEPKLVRNKYTGELLCVPCGKCSSCRSRRSALWVARLREESACHAFTLFGTLTYDDSHLPRLCPDFVDEKLQTDSYLKAVVDSSSFIDAHKGLVPCVSTKHIQDFFKRLRSSLDYYLKINYGKDQKSDIRYFVCSEYGPTTFRPHYHLLIWFDNAHLYPVIKSYIFKAWKCNTCFTKLSDFLQRNKWKFVKGHCEEYLAGYLNCDTRIPEILRQKPFRTFHLQSSVPPIGTIRVLKESVKSLLSGDACQVALRRLSSTSSVVIPLWRGLENRFFPKCLSFANLTSRDRIALYGISQSYYEVGQRFDCFETFREWVYNKWSCDVPTIRLLRAVLTCEKEDVGRFERSLKYIFNLSARVRKLAQYASCSLESYVSGIEAYYSRKEYESLRCQLAYEELMSRSHRTDNKLSFYPFLVDSLFYENLRDLPYSTYVSYLEQFGLGKLNDYMFVREKSLDYKDVKGRCDMIVRNNNKTRVKKDYVDNHPECRYTYRDLLRTFV